MKPFKNTIILAIFICIFTLSEHAGFLLGFFLVFYVVYFLVSIYKLIFKNNKKTVIIKNLVLISIFLLIFGRHYYLHITTRNLGNEVVQIIDAYYLKNGKYPESINDVGISNYEYQGKRFFLSIRNGEPFLWYPATWIPFDTYEYDFKTKQWEFAPS